MALPTFNSNPLPLGLIVPGASFATVSKPITANFPELATSAPYGQVDSIYVHALAGNDTGVIYICNTAVQPNTTTYANVVDVIASGASTSISSAGMNTLQLSQFYIGSGDATSGCIVTVKYR